MNGRNLDHTAGQLSPRDRAILSDLEKFRLLSTRHIQRLHFDHAHASTVAAARACTRVLMRLRDHALITPLERRVGGVRRGSASYVWQLGARGDRLLRRLRGQPQRRRYVEPSHRFTHHTLAVADVAIDLLEAHRRHSQTGRFAIEHLGTEPANWISHLGPHGEKRWVKPDLHLIATTSDLADEVATGDTNPRVFENHAFLEIDLGTEHIPRILAKSAAYATYAATGAYQARHGLFPAVVWLNTDETRRAALAAAIAGDARLPVEMFQVTDPRDYIGGSTR